MKLREIAFAIDEDLPQTVKYHLDKLIKKGLLEKLGTNDIRAVNPESEIDGLVKIPLLGQANCGQALIYAPDDIQGFLPVSPSILNTRQYQDLFAVQAVGHSMNASDIDGKSIQEGDYVIAKKMPFYEEGIYIVATFEGLANVKRIVMDHNNGHVILQSESLDPMPPIYIGNADIDRLQVHGRVIQVLKNPKYAVTV